MTLVADISDEDTGVASSMFNAGQQRGGVATIGTVAWSAFNHNVKSSLARIAAPVSHAATHAAASVSPGSPIYDHALSSGLTRGRRVL